LDGAAAAPIAQLLEGLALGFAIAKA